MRPVASGGTVNAVFRVGDDLALRVPLRPFHGDLREPALLRRLAPRLPVAIPRPYAHDAERGWTIQQWLPASLPAHQPVDDGERPARHPRRARR